MPTPEEKARTRPNRLQEAAEDEAEAEDAANKVTEEEDQAKLLDLWEDISEERPVPELLRDCAIQRLMQALGAYANILHEQQIDWYAQHIPTAARLLLSQVGNTPLEAPLRPVLETSIEK